MEVAQENEKQQNERGEQPHEAEPAAAPEAQADVAEAGGAAAPAENDELAALRREVQELRDRNLRLLAEMRNTHARLQRDKVEALRFAEAEFARELLVVLDDLERMQDSARSGESLQPVLEGVRIVREHFQNVLRKRGIQQIEAVGKPFDPELHEALLQQPSDEFPAGTVVQELARGYRMHDRVLRHARVVVSTGPAGESAPEVRPAAD